MCCLNLRAGSLPNKGKPNRAIISNGLNLCFLTYTIVTVNTSIRLLFLKILIFKLGKIQLLKKYVILRSENKGIGLY